MKHLSHLKPLIAPIAAIGILCLPQLTAAASPEVKIDWNDVHQRITGFGASGGNDSAGNFQKLSPRQQRRLGDLLFDVKKGIGLTMVRNEIYAWKIQPTPETWDWTQDNDQVWLMRQAKARGTTNFWSAVWSPPLWMKSNGILTNGGSLLMEDSQAYADLLTRYVREYKTRFNLDIAAVSIANEPEIKQSYQSTTWTGEQMRDFIRDHLGPAFRRAGLKTRLIVPETSVWNNLPHWADVILADPEAAGFVSVIATHQYDQSYTGTGPRFPPAKPESAYPAAKIHGKEFWQTEVSFIGGKPDPGMGWGLGTALLIHNAMIGGEVNAWVWWVFLNDWKDNEGLTDLAGNSFIVNKRLWAFGNYSRFVRPGWVMIGATSNPATNIFVSAFKDPDTGKFALVAINNTETAVTFSARFDGFVCTSLRPWVTDSAFDLAKMAPVKTSSSGCSLTLRAKSVTTFVGAQCRSTANNRLATATIIAAAESTNQAAITPFKELSKDMLFGTEVDPDALINEKPYTSLLTNHYNIVVPENDLKFENTERSRGNFSFEKADKVVRFAQEHGMVVRGHVLVYQWQSEWLRNNYVDQYDNAPEGKFAAKDVKAILDKHIETVMGRYKGRIKYWDVVNEVICDPVGTNNVDRSSMDTILQHSFWYKAFKLLKEHGDVSEDFVSYAFRKAHAVDPDCKLFLNDYGIEGFYGWGEKSFAARALVKSLLEHGVPINGVGLQMHQNYGNDPSAGDNLAGNIQAYKDMGLEVQVTECDIKIELPVLSTSPDKVYGEPTPADLANQARTYYNIVKTCKESGNVSAFLTWGFTDKYSWIPWKYPGWGWALPFDKNYQPKPAALAIEKALIGEPLP